MSTIDLRTAQGRETTVDRSVTLYAVIAFVLTAALAGFIALYSGSAALIITLGLVAAVFAPIVAFGGLFDRK